ncbi:hypothetical protein CROQUDRAFT_100458 [Cronartium quercuum f. sp. fusiforme G11]|uniref:Secreted protein n=1 Tax=Cronartium quercuum f. sp. fusiforme G11 TaxID=708437 RepID=A0A9P6N762_9BASI|nr:hypothetical protein CROQUDRAFT_100458 [Cronartium quercuum f. sp. fusiforme G11]
MIAGQFLFFCLALCWTNVLSYGPPLQTAVTCTFGYRVRPVDNGVTVGLCTVGSPTDDYLCTRCNQTVPVGRQCLKTSKVVFPIPSTANMEFPCPNYEKISNPDGTFAGYGCADAKKGQKAFCKLMDQM